MGKNYDLPALIRIYKEYVYNVDSDYCSAHHQHGGKGVRWRLRLERLESVKAEMILLLFSPDILGATRFSYFMTGISEMMRRLQIRVNSTGLST